MDALSTVSGRVRMAGEVSACVFCVGILTPMGWDCAQFVRMATSWVGMVYFTAVISCIYIADWSMRRMSVVGHLTAYRSALFVELGLRGLFAFVCDRVVPFPAKVYCVEACRKL